MSPVPPLPDPTWAALPTRTSAPPGGSARAAAVARLQAWALEGGARLDGVALSVDAAGDGAVRAARAIAVGERLLTIPRALMVRDDELAATATGAIDLGPEVAGPRDALAVWLPLEARRPDSRWRAFLDVQPAAFADLPMFRGGDELAPLAGTAARRAAAAAHADVVDTYARLPVALRAQVSLADYAWGRAIVASRGFNAPDTLDDRVAFIPVADLFNHHPGQTRWQYDPLTAVWSVEARRAFAAGDEVHFDYGAKGNTALLVGYGFALPDNPATAVALALPGAPAITVTARFDDDARAALATARRRAAGLGPVDDDDDDAWRGVEVERAAMTMLAAAALTAHDRIAPPDDTPASDSWRRSCSVVRAGERAVLAATAAFARAAIAHLAAPTRAALVATADALAPTPHGPDALLRGYLRAAADALVVG